MAGTVFFGLVYFFLVMLQCLPSMCTVLILKRWSLTLLVRAFWDVHPASSECLPRGPTLGITYALAAVNATADWAFGVLPFFIVWDLEMKRTTKMLVAGILAFAAM